MKVLPFKQQSDQWYAARNSHFCASDAAAMMGASPYKSRDDLLKEKATGIKEEINPTKQALFDKGHAAEDAARKIIEKQIGVLFPVVCEKGDMLASLDGITMDEKINFEHKLWNKKLAAAVEKGELPASHYWQLEHQHWCSGCEKTIFVVSDGTKENMVQMEYIPVPGRLEELKAGWAQFIVDLNGYKPVTATIEPTGKAVMALPTLLIDIEGKVKSSNLIPYENAAMAFVQSISTELNTDQDFADAENLIKFCQQVEDDLKLVKKQALSQTADIEAIFNSVDRVDSEYRDKRLTLNKKVKSRKEEIKFELVNQSNTEIRAHIDGLTTEYGSQILRDINPDFAGAIKGRRSIDPMREACNDELARCKIESNQIMEGINANQKDFDAMSDQHKMLFADIADLVFCSSEQFQATASKRMEDHDKEEKRKQEAAENERIAKIKARIANIEKTVLGAVTATLEEAKRVLVRLDAIDLTDGFEEFADDATKVVIDSIDQVTKLIEQKQAVENARIEQESRQQAETTAEEPAEPEVVNEETQSISGSADTAGAMVEEKPNLSRAKMREFGLRISKLAYECPAVSDLSIQVQREAVFSALIQASELAQQ